MEIEKIELTNNLFTYLYKWEVENPKAVLQIVHGSKENILRYKEMIEHLNNKGISVFGIDLRGHGQASFENKTLGNTGMNKNEIINDIEEVSKIIKARYGDLPYTIYGHSMGSFLVRAHASKYGAPNYIFSGTNEQSRTLSKFAIFVARLTRFFKGKNKVNKLIDDLSYKSFAKQFKSENDPDAWKSNDPIKNKDSNSEGVSAHDFTNESFIMMLSTLDEIAKKKSYENIKAQRILLVAGENDPVGKNGKGPKIVHKKLIKHGLSSNLIIYPNGRHEVHNDLNRKVVYGDIEKFILKNNSF